MSSKKKVTVPVAPQTAFDQFFALLGNENTFEQIWPVCIDTAETKEQLIKLTTVPAVAADPAKIEQVWDSLMADADSFEKLMEIAGYEVFHSQPDIVNTMWRYIVSHVRTQEQIDSVISLPIFATREGKDEDLFDARARLVTDAVGIAALVKMYPNKASRIMRMLQGIDLTEADIHSLVDACPEWKPALYKRLLQEKEAQLERVLVRLGQEKQNVATLETRFNASAVQVTVQLSETEEVVREAERALLTLTRDAKQAEQDGEAFETARDVYLATLKETDGLQTDLIELDRHANIAGPFMEQLPNIPNAIIMRGLQQEPVPAPEVTPSFPSATPTSNVQPFQHAATPSNTGSAHLDTGIVTRFRALLSKVGEIANYEVSIPGIK